MELAGGLHRCLGKGRQRGGQTKGLSELCFLKKNHEAFAMKGAKSLSGWLWMLSTVSGAVLEAFLLSGIIILWQKYLLARYLPSLFELYSSIAEV